MTRRVKPATAAFAACAVALLVVTATVASGALVGGAAAVDGDTAETAAIDADEPTDGEGFAGASLGQMSGDDRAESPTRCFSGKGYPIGIGDGQTRIATIVHLSVLTDPAAGNEFGLEAAGTIAGDPIVTLGAGVRLTARDAIANGLDPFAAFDVLYAYELHLPMFAGAIDESDYRDDGSPIDSSATPVPC
ncbi:hypothetical protein [Halorubrum sp. PV6]|uniref:DUF7332 family protein n=1 Tax=Halorubrum sp. PV6 TaxID=634157 RepID=UPI000F853BBF|nr:hypothetical protein [Halorubrum sp. PV6]AZQ14365.1 hypothetical protein DOS48_05755 [Halorubrum sp. PV6]